MRTHEVANQPSPLVGYNVYESDRALVAAVHREGAAWANDRLTKIGEAAGTEHAQKLGALANENPPRLRTHDRYGNRIDEVEFHPSWHELMTVAVENGLHSLPWVEGERGAHVARAAMFMVWSQVEGGHGCPISMTYSVIPALRNQPELAREWEPRFLSQEYDPRFIPAGQKRGALCGMAMTEKQGGSDVRANTTTAQPLGAGGPGGEYLITGHKWFCSAPMCDAFLVLAQAPGGLSCFLMPRWTPDGERNRFHIQRLKDKLGNRSNASSEVEFDEAWAQLVGEEGRGVPTIIEMVTHTRLDCVIGTSTGMRHATAMAIHHASHRSAFGRLLAEQPLMLNVLADLAVESEAATMTAMRLARAFDESSDNEHEKLFKRIAAAVSKYWICKRGPVHAAEALECLGGNGYIEESGMPRLFRESPLNSIWEGSGNVICLDVLRAMRKSPESVEVFIDEVSESASSEPRLADAVALVKKELSDLDDIETRARRIVELMALTLQGSLLVRHATEEVKAAFVASRLAGDWGRAFGTLPASVDLKAIVNRAAPA